MSDKRKEQRGRSCLAWELLNEWILIPQPGRDEEAQVGEEACQGPKKLRQEGWIHTLRRVACSLVPVFIE